MTFDKIPEYLKREDRWVCWRTEDRGGKPTKVPINPLTGNRAMSNNPSTWGSFYDAIECLQKGTGLNGIGFMFNGDGIVGVDIDNCRDPESGVIEDFAKDIINTIDSYTETSQSGKGIHIICSGKLPEGKRRKGSVEMYETGRFFVMTGNIIDDAHMDIEGRTEELAAVHKKYLSETEKAKTVNNPVETVLNLDENEIIQKAMAAKNGTLFSQLFQGSWKGIYGSQSEADMAFCNMLAFWCGRDYTMMDRVFRKSGMYRDKWDEKRGACSYGEKTLKEAINSCSEVYTPSFKKAAAPAQHQEAPEIDLGLFDVKRDFGTCDNYQDNSKANIDSSKLFKLGCSLRAKGMEHDDLLKKMIEANNMAFPSLEDSEVEKVCKTICEKYPAGPVFKRNEENDKVLDITENTEVLLSYLNIYIYYDEISKSIKIIKNSVEKDLEDQDINDIIDKKITFGHPARKDRVYDHIYAIALNNQRNPFLEYLESQYMIYRNEFGVDSDLILEEVFECIELECPENWRYDFEKFKRWLVQTVRITTNKGSTFVAELVLTLQGAQGIYKTTFFRMLCPEAKWFKDGVYLDPDNKDIIMMALKHPIVELGELDSTMNRTDQARLKAFLSESFNLIRAPYGRTPTKISRMTSFCATVNKKEFLKDETGGRRFLIIPVKKIDIERLKKININQVWAYAYHLFKTGYKWYFDEPEYVETFARMNHDFNITSSKISAFVEDYGGIEKILGKTIDEIYSGNDFNLNYQVHSYCAWCAATGEKPLSRVWFGRELGKLYNVTTMVKRVEGKLSRIIAKSGTDEKDFCQSEIDFDNLLSKK